MITSSIVVGAQREKEAEGEGAGGREAKGGSRGEGGRRGKRGRRRREGEKTEKEEEGRQKNNFHAHTIQIWSCNHLMTCPVQHRPRNPVPLGNPVSNLSDLEPFSMHYYQRNIMVSSQLTRVPFLCRRIRIPTC